MEWTPAEGNALVRIRESTAPGPLLSWRKCAPLLNAKFWPAAAAEGEETLLPCRRHGSLPNQYTRAKERQAAASS